MRAKYFNFFFWFILSFFISSTGLTEESLIFVVNKDNPVTSLSDSDITDYFLKARTHWPDGTPVRFIDWKEGSSIRSLFLDEIVGKSTREVELYWIGQKLYTGNSAPIRVLSDAMVIRFVSKLKGAIGYVSNATVIDLTKVKRIELVRDE